MTPYAVIKAALDAGDNAKVSKENSANVLSFPIASAGCLATGPCNNPRIAFKVILDAKNLIQRVESRSDNPVLGDLLTETTYSDYKDFGKLKFPTRILQKQGGFPVWNLTITKVDTEYPYVYIRPPAAVRAAAQQKAPPKVEAQKVAEGVWYLTGGTHHSVADEFKYYLVLVECTLDDQCTMAVLAAVKQNMPNKPIPHVVNSRHHRDKLRVLRACPEEGATMLTHSAAKTY